MNFNLFKKIVEDKEAPVQQPAPATDNKAIQRLQADIEKINASLQIMQEMRKASTQRITQMEEQIGELRGIISEKERLIKELQVQVMRATEIVSQTKPEKLMLEVEKLNAKVEVTQAKIISYHKIADKIMGNLKDIRKHIEIFKGVRQLIKLSEDAKEQLGEIQKIKAGVERHTNTAENILIKIESKYSEFSRYKKMNEDLKEQFNELIKEVDSLKIKTIGPSEGILSKIKNAIAVKREIHKKPDDIAEKV